MLLLFNLGFGAPSDCRGFHEVAAASILDRDMLTCHKRSCYLWIHVDFHILLLDQPLVPFLALLIDPSLKGLAYDCVNDIGNAE